MTDELMDRLERRITGYGSDHAVVAFSGGVDSAVVTALAAKALSPERVAAVTAVSPSYPGGELEFARQTAADLSVEHRVVETHEVERVAYARNDAMRCYQCKTELYGVLRRIAAEANGSVVLAGTNADDQIDLRPGLLAAEEQGVRNPLLEEGAGKAEVRALARQLRLAVADKPALACLSSRVAFGIGITSELLHRIDRAEGEVRALGFDPVRIRHFGDRASIEVAPQEVGRLLAHPKLSRLLASLRAIGWKAVEVDPLGYRQGSMNATLFEPTSIA
jgi:uncharacterized protein